MEDFNLESLELRRCSLHCFSVFDFEFPIAAAASFVSFRTFDSVIICDRVYGKQKKELVDLTR